ncbi:response regulator transcription factor [Alkaliphilus sp. B6464]|uniref:response regulator transcription factor n=1 Tax=Alkaliphilus sp. B6464 TaxID=2731219 RepID=UPI001BA7002A|nr:response regulator transcription factor [Alkaliphilus sp. B6464]QUH21493.1 response regulator transcription factor [Alkaliphilus sp. B6464]
MHSILLVEDDSTLAMGIEYSLKNEGYKVKLANNAALAKQLIDEETYELIILDITLPDGNGYDLCKYVRNTKETPVIFLTALDEEVNVVMGLDIGGDDYITKPFKIRELLSRIRAVLRRYSQKSPEGILKSDDIKVIQIQNKVYVNNKEIFLTPSEYKLLVFLMLNANKVLSRNAILEKLWDIEGDFIDDNTLSVYIRRLREKIEKDSSNPFYIKTVRGLGYTWDKEVGGE